MTEKRTAEIKDWYVDLGGHLHGKVYNDPRFEDGEMVHTTKMLIIETKNTRYKIMGDPTRI